MPETAPWLDIGIIAAVVFCLSLGLGLLDGLIDRWYCNKRRK